MRTKEKPLVGGLSDAVCKSGKWARQDSNLGPTDYESAALTAELRALRR
jgi:hypothetical protein